ncbi:rod shape-determining protein MreC [Candidatus Dojkabacteria bacterium]|nr:rod shape-determining protein MreC [Candidatus Dojkabacteria bacterium]
MSEKSKDTTISYLLAVIFAGVLVVFADINGYLSSVHDFASQFVVPVETELNNIGKTIGSIGNSIVYWIGLKEENIKCRNELSELKAKTALLEDIIEENQELKSQIGSFSRSAVQTTQARIVKYGPNVLGWGLKLDKGTADGVSNGNVVVYGNNLIGYIQDADAYTSNVELVNSSTSNLYSEVQRSRKVGIVRGKKDGLFIEELLPSDSIGIGDVIIVWDEKLSITLIVGEVIRVIDDPTATTKSAEIEQYVTIDDLEYVYILERR